MPTPPRRTTRTALALTMLVASGTAALGCSKSDPGGEGSARAVVDRHVELSRAYDIAGDCNLKHPDEIARMAAFDDTDADGYCDRATREVIANATAAVKARTRKLYTNPKIEELDRPGAGEWFLLTSADDRYHETIHVVEEDGRWWLDSADGTDVEATDDHGH